jgi:hypothetical protein
MLEIVWLQKGARHAAKVSASRFVCDDRVRAAYNHQAGPIAGRQTEARTIDREASGFDRTCCKAQGAKDNHDGRHRSRRYRVGGKASFDGDGNLLSDGMSSRFALRFGAKEYPGEGFVFENDFLLKEGLLFGSLSSAWALQHIAQKQPRLEVTGIKTVNGRSLWEMKYTPKKGNAAIQTYLYFDTETFRHVRSQYRSELVSPEFQNIDTNALKAHYTITEDFDDFSDVDGITRPHSYKLDLVIDSRSKEFAGSWTYAIKQAVRNQVLDRQLFAVN